MRLSKFLPTLMLAATMLVAGGAHSQSTAAAPDAMVRDLSNEVLNAIKADKALASGDTMRVQKLVDEKILPYVDFEKMTRLAVGRGWRQATPEQRAALTREFRTLLVRTYSGALSQVKDHQVQLRRNCRMKAT
jgi:phospholipid transport system substrate-binding protein